MERKVKHSKINVYDFLFANTTRKIYTNIVFSLLLVIVLLIFAVIPIISTLTDKKNKIQRLEELNNKASEKLTASQILQTQINSTYKEQIDFVNKVFQQSLSLTNVYNNLKKRAEDSNVVIRSINPQYATGVQSANFDNSPLSPSVNSYTLNINAEGKDIVSVQNFVKKLEGNSELPIFSRVQSVNILDEVNAEKVSNLISSDDEKVIVLDLKLVVYVDSTRFITPQNQ